MTAQERRIVKQEERIEIEAKLRAKGLSAFLYGGAKGHGWWINGLGWTPYVDAKRLVAKYRT